MSKPGTIDVKLMLRERVDLFMRVAEIAPDPEGGRPLVELRMIIGGDAGYHFDDVQLMIPRPMDDVDEPGSEASSAEP